jgi:hypothetical protein
MVADICAGKAETGTRKLRNNQGYFESNINLLVSAEIS